MLTLSNYIGGGISMAKYTKIFKKYTNNKYHITNKEITSQDFSSNSSYTDIMLTMYDNNYEQIIIDTGLMLSIIKKSIQLGWILNDIHIDDPSIDGETLSTINSIVNKMRDNSIFFEDLKEYLIWASNDSILITNITLVKLDSKEILIAKVHSNGLLSEKNQKEIYELVVKQEISSYLNGNDL